MDFDDGIRRVPFASALRVFSEERRERQNLEVMPPSCGRSQLARHQKQRLGAATRWGVSWALRTCSGQCRFRYSSTEALIEHYGELFAGRKPFTDVSAILLEVADGEIDQLEALHNSWNKNDPKDAQVILQMLEVGALRFLHDPLVSGTADIQKLSKTHEVVSRSKAALWHRILTHSMSAADLGRLHSLLLLSQDRDDRLIRELRSLHVRSSRWAGR